jgi:hypothetical protein
MAIIREDERTEILTVLFILCDSPASEFYVPTFRNRQCSETLTHKFQTPGESPKRNNTKFRTRRKFEINNGEPVCRKCSQPWNLLRYSLGCSKNIQLVFIKYLHRLQKKKVHVRHFEVVAFSIKNLRLVFFLKVTEFLSNF